MLTYLDDPPATTTGHFYLFWFLIQTELARKLLKRSSNVTQSASLGGY